MNKVLMCSFLPFSIKGKRRRDFKFERNLKLILDYEKLLQKLKFENYIVCRTNGCWYFFIYFFGQGW